MKIEEDQDHPQTFNVRLGIREAIYLCLVLARCNIREDTVGFLGYNLWARLNLYISGYFGVPIGKWNRVRADISKNVMWDPASKILTISTENREAFFKEIFKKILE